MNSYGEPQQLRLTHQGVAGLPPDTLNPKQVGANSAGTREAVADLFSDAASTELILREGDGHGLETVRAPLGPLEIIVEDGRGSRQAAPMGSNCGVAILAPVPEPTGGSLGEHPVVDRGAISQRDHAAACSIGGNLQGLAAQLALCRQSGGALPQVQQPLGTVPANDAAGFDRDLGYCHSHGGGDTGTGEAVSAVGVCHVPGGVRAPVGSLGISVRDGGTLAMGQTPDCCKA